MTGARVPLHELPWLPRQSEDFKAALRRAGSDATGAWELELSRLATQYLGLSQVLALSKRLGQLRRERPSATLIPFKLGIVGEATFDFLIPFIEITGLRYGLLIDVVTGEFGQPAQQALDPLSSINAARPDAVLIALDHRSLPFDNLEPVRRGWRQSPATAVQLVRSMREGFRTHGGAVSLVQTVPQAGGPLFGSMDPTVEGTSRRTVAEFNRVIADDVAQTGDLLVDTAHAANAVGTDCWFDLRNWHLGRLPCSERVLPWYAEHIVRVVAAMRGKSRKCLVLDLDNTVWGGVIGDDGIQGICLDQGDPRGEAYRAVQKAALALKQRGILLAVCSKNDLAVAKMPFESHPSMLLKDDDIAVFVANWADKASNLEQIARRLDIGLDSLVLLDDNPIEREQVRQALPQVAVPELGRDPSSFVETLLHAGYFEATSFTEEDAKRAQLYKSNADRVQLLESSRDLDGFLRSLEMTVRFAPFDQRGRKRITQLINKTNQFNLTTRRYTEAEVAEMEVSEGVYGLQVSLSDRFGDEGMVCVVICRKSPAVWEIDSWLMSCRVLNRRLEQAVCNHVAAAALAAGAKALVGRYRPTARNAMVADLLVRLGFDAAGAEPEGALSRLDLEAFVPFDVPMSIAA